MNVETIGQLKYRSSIWLRDDLFQAADLEIGKHFLVTVRVYHPFCHKIGMRNTHGPRCSQEIVLLGNQMLTDLRDKILCPSDLAVSSEVSENPDQNVTQKTTDEYKSGFIFIEDTFYSDYRDPTNRDYSRVIREWAASHDLGPFQTGVMEKTKFEALTVRLGYPYVYQHQGNCEHLIVFSDLRLLHVSDSLSLQNYPCCRSISSANARYCMICNYYVARWITFENERVPFDPCFFCEHCFRSYNYVDGKKVGNFKAYPFYDKTAL
ncbi:snRNA-activating protein complex subunit 3 isoform X2 [Zootermopsis nevadensis]|nr:snRNA-activating protein complex subunit 3 isoform X2 [Zootermopsis nevadensis]XP_021940853.1 snRNA-activating protein complex subunit 3 isoform X2 [Zootermopsis nevadensis]XP_021940863.1 snRNA-activating protein complex subunit 3 isoform X2 [Zootermopsis nevadensis]XP_021940869.1 snRNA-activating protein complex subunit 3 isoform X2 [Zootermopsis nevadensis]XP_021940876.1 snRNA-activating protein complex subunit 3 isoform X2 [Zootermopsis nevadensis]